MKKLTLLLALTVTSCSHRAVVTHSPSDQVLIDRTDRSERSEAVVYEVMPSDSLHSIAARYSVSVADVVRENNLERPYTLKAGQILHIPPQSSSTSHGDAVPTPKTKTKIILGPRLKS